MAFFNGWPWTQFQEQNLDWIIRKIKELSLLPIEFEELKEYVYNYLNNLDITQDVKDYLDEMYDDGRLSTLIQSYTAADFARIDARLDKNSNAIRRRIMECGQIIAAHAGNNNAAPENSKAGINICCQTDFDAVEFDTQISADAVPIVAHNDDLSTFTTASGLISTQNYGDFSTAVITVGPRNSDFDNTSKTIPSVQDALNIIKNHRNIIPVIDVKDSYTTQSQIDALVDIVRNSGMLYNTIFLGDTESKCEMLRESDPNICIMRVLSAVTAADITFCLNNNIDGIDANVGGITLADVQLMRAAGLLVGVWTIPDYNNTSVVSTARTYHADMWTVASMRFMATGQNYAPSNYSVNVYAVDDLNGVAGINKFDSSRIRNELFTYHTDAGAGKYPNVFNYSSANRAAIMKAYPCEYNQVIPVNAVSGYEYSLVMLANDGTKISSTAWSSSDITISASGAVAFVIEGRKSDNSNLDYIDLKNLQYGIHR